MSTRHFPASTPVGFGAATQPDSPQALGSTASAVVHARLREQVAELSLRDPEVRHNAPDGVHKMRVAIRRLRSALATFRPLLDPQVTSALREELKWVAGVLGEARDAEVLRERLAAAIVEEPPDLAPGLVAARVDRQLSSISRHALVRSAEAMESDRYLTLLDDLEKLVEDPQWTPLGGEQARSVLPGRVRRDWKRLRRAVAAAEEADTEPERDHLLHEVRKAAKRVRYTAETLVPVYGADAQRLARATQRMQSVLGNHHDGVVTQDRLLQLADQANVDGDNAFVYGRLHAREQARSADAADRFPKTWRRVKRVKPSRWTG